MVVKQEGNELTIIGQAEEGDHMNGEIPVFKSYLRESLEHQKELGKAIEEKILPVYVLPHLFFLPFYLVNLSY